jgi:hypothetical protein
LSDDTDAILKAQGVGWFLRKAIGAASITLDIKHYKDDDRVEHIDIVQTLTGGIPGTTELRILWWKEKEHEDAIFGSVIGKSRRVKAEELQDEYLTKGWTADTYDHGLVQSYAESNTPKSGITWIANQVHNQKLNQGFYLTIVYSHRHGEWRRLRTKGDTLAIFISLQPMAKLSRRGWYTTTVSTAIIAKEIYLDILPLSWFNIVAISMRCIYLAYNGGSTTPIIIDEPFVL